MTWDHPYMYRNVNYLKLFLLDALPLGLQTYIYLTSWFLKDPDSLFTGSNQIKPVKWIILLVHAECLHFVQIFNIT